jgi:uncharacterized membrane protein
MPATASDRRRSGYRLAAREVPAPWVAAAAVVALGLLLFAGGGPLRPALATFGLGALAALALTWLHGAAARHRARRRADAAHAAGADLARAVANRAGGDLHVFDRADEPGTLTVLELPARA